MQTVNIYTDGSVWPNPGPGGWCAILQSGEHERVLTGHAHYTTNNQMEMLAVLYGLQAIKSPCFVNVFTDSEYVSNAFNNNWLQKWQAARWLRNGNEPVPNATLWQDLVKEVNKHPVVTFYWVKSHSQHEQNNRADTLARAERLAIALPKGEPGLQRVGSEA